MNRFRISSRLAAMGLLVFVLSASCKPQAGKPAEPIQLSAVQLWASDTLFKTPESVLYDRKGKVAYVANVNGNPSEKDGNGFISRLGLDGSIIQLDWVTGLDAPKGMAIWKDRLYVSDINLVVEIELSTGKILNRYEATDAAFLNDISCDINGHVYISDSGDGKVYLLYQGMLEIWLKSDELKGVNGLWVENDHVLMGCENRIVRVHHQTKKIEPFIENTGGIDGLVPDGTGNYVISDWKGHVNYVGPQIQKQLLFDTTPQEVNAADIDFLIDEHIILVPTFWDNRVVAYSLK